MEVGNEVKISFHWMFAWRCIFEAFEISLILNLVLSKSLLFLTSSIWSGRAKYEQEHSYPTGVRGLKPKPNANHIKNKSRGSASECCHTPTPNSSRRGRRRREPQIGRGLHVKKGHIWQAKRAARPTRQAWPRGFARLLIISHCVSQH
jgi:hypothetical protein